MACAGVPVSLRHGSARLRAASIVAAFAAFAASIGSARGDEAGVSFWIPGFYGSLAATPQVPGWSLATIYYHTSVSAGADVAFARQVPAGHLTVPFTGQITGNLNASADLGMGIPQYVFATPVLGGQAAIGMIVPIGNARTSVDAALTGAAGPIGFTVAGSRTDDVTGFGDLVPQASLRWHDGVHNWMTYVTGDVPVGRYDATSLANLGIGHGAIDAGGGYTYLDQTTGREFSAVLGFTYNFVNPDTQYQSGVDMHFDWGASQFLSKQLLVGLVGYAYDQLSCDSGAGDRVGCFESRVLGVGPQVGYIFPLGDGHRGYLNLKAYKEFDNNARPDGWNVWLTFAISDEPPSTSTPSHLITK
ncbi:MAG TPA: transporter [Xanthobacteraceae bacterium]